MPQTNCFADRSNGVIKITPKRGASLFMTQRTASIESTIHFDLIIPSLVVPGRKQLARLVAHEIAKVIGIKERILSGRLAEKEKENPSAMGDGIALMHLHMSSLQNAMTVFIRLKNPVDMTAPDNKPVDILCVLLTPEREGPAYLRTMARLSRLLRNDRICAKLRATSDEKTIRSILDQSSIQLMAA
jgi:PTS system nitrogen regulatory IIA component